MGNKVPQAETANKTYSSTSPQIGVILKNIFNKRKDVTTSENLSCLLKQTNARIYDVDEMKKTIDDNNFGMIKDGPIISDIDINLVNIDPMIDMKSVGNINRFGILNVFVSEPSKDSKKCQNTFTMNMNKTNNYCSFKQKISNVKDGVTTNTITNLPFYETIANIFKDDNYSKYLHEITATDNTSTTSADYGFKFVDNNLNILFFNKVNGIVNLSTNGPVAIISLESNLTVNFTFDPELKKDIVEKFGNMKSGKPMWIKILLFIAIVYLVYIGINIICNDNSNNSNNSNLNNIAKL
jgi:hypothetical protein